MTLLQGILESAVEAEYHDLCTCSCSFHQRTNRVYKVYTRCTSVDTFSLETDVARWSKLLIWHLVDRIRNNKIVLNQSKDW